MKRLLAIVDAGDAGVTGVLAGEALRRAARDAGQPIEMNGDAADATGAAAPEADGATAPTAGPAGDAGAAAGSGTFA